MPAPSGERGVRRRIDHVDAGALLLREIDRFVGLFDRVAACFKDHRDPRLTEHSVRTLVAQRITGIALGYEDLNDHDDLRHDPLLALLAGRLEGRRKGWAGIAVQEIGTPDAGQRRFEVLDDERQERSLLVIRRVDGALRPERGRRPVVRFSKREHSPSMSDEIWVSTLARYREREDLEDARYDPMEGRVKLNAAPFFAKQLSKAGFDVSASSFSAEAQYATSLDPWVYCTAFCPANERDAYRLGKRISPDNDTITKILDVDAFALELGVDLTITLDELTHTKPVSGEPLLQKLSLADTGFHRVVHVSHGPVAYEDISGTLDTGQEPFDLASRTGFIKPKSFSYQSEYRFALQTSGEPAIRTLRIPVSEALRECTSLR